MLAPAPRLLWFTFCLALPALTLLAVAPHAWPIALTLILLYLAAAALDAQRLFQLTAPLSVSVTAAHSAYKDRASVLAATISQLENSAILGLTFEWPNTFDVESPVAAVLSQSEIAFSYTPRARGEFLIQKAFLLARSPWHLWNLRLERPVTSGIRVFPDLSKDPAARKVFATLQQGQRIQRLIGRGREVERLREYAPGDSFDEVYWKATARRGMPISKVFQVERTQDIYAVVDSSRLGSRNQALERFVSASLLLAITAERNADNFGLLTFSDQVHHFVRASHGKGHFHRCREVIYAIQPAPISPDFAELFTFINLRIRKRALLFFLTDLSDPLLSETFLRDASLISRHVAVVNQIADAADRPLFTGDLPADELAVQTRLAGHLQWAKLRELERSLSHLGIRMHLLQPERASSGLISQYIAIKQRQLL